MYHLCIQVPMSSLTQKVWDEKAYLKVKSLLKTFTEKLLLLKEDVEK